MNKSGKSSDKKRVTRFKTSEPGAAYSKLSDTTQKKHNVVVLHVGSGKEGRVVLGAYTSHRNLIKNWYDIYEDKKVKVAGDPLHYHSKMELVEVAQKGVGAKTIDRLAELLKITKKQASEFFHFSERSLNDYIKKDQILDPDSSEKILKMFSLYLLGLEVFRSRDNFINWLSKPSFGLRNKIPKSLLSSSAGIDLIQEELSRIEHGDFA